MPIKPSKIKSFRFLKYKIKIKEKIEMYTNKVPISGWRRRSVITKLMIIKLIIKYNLLLVLIYK